MDEESERAAADAIALLMDKLNDNRRELASARDREMALKERIITLEARVKQPAPLPVVRQRIPMTAALQGEMFAHHGGRCQTKMPAWLGSWYLHAMSNPFRYFNSSSS